MARFRSPRQELPWSVRTEPLRARKFAFVESDGVRAAFLGLIQDVTYQADDRALCLVASRSLQQFQQDGAHHPPEPACSCGYYSLSPDELRAEMLAMRIRLKTKRFLPPLLDVEMYGRVIRHQRGWRSERQRVLAVTFPPVCVCDRPATALSTFFGDWMGERYLSSTVFPVCAKHYRDGPLPTVGARAPRRHLHRGLRFDRTRPIAHAGRRRQHVAHRSASGHRVSLDTTMTALAIAIGAKLPVLVWGPPGAGKSSAIRALAQTLCLPCEVVIASVREPTDFSGLPVVVDGDVRFAPPRWASRLAAAERGILFLDEISTAPPAVQAALLRVVLDRVVGDLALPNDVVVVAAANPPDVAADGWDLSAPLANRFVHLQWEPDVAAFAAGMVQGWPTPDARRLPAGWEKTVPGARALVASFVAARPGLLSAVPPDATTAGRGWPSPRSWDMAAQLWAATEATHASSDVQVALVRGSVGDGPAIEFLSYLVDLDLPSPEEVLAAADRFPVPERADRLYALLNSVVAAVVAHPSTRRWTAGWHVLARAGADRPDVAATCARWLAQNRPPGAKVPEVATIFAPVLRAAGLL